MESLLSDMSVTSEDILKKLNSLRTDKSADPDNIHPKVLSEIKLSICHPLTLLFNKSLSEGTLPHEWKSGILSPIFKKGDKQQVVNYRPVSLTSVSFVNH